MKNLFKRVGFVKNEKMDTLYFGLKIFNKQISDLYIGHPVVADVNVRNLRLSRLT